MTFSSNCITRRSAKGKRKVGYADLKKLLIIHKSMTRPALSNNPRRSVLCYTVEYNLIIYEGTELITSHHYKRGWSAGRILGENVQQNTLILLSRK